MLISADFDGTNVTAVNWPVLEATLAGANDPDNASIHPGYIDRSPCQGILDIAWLYESAGANETGPFRVNNVNLYESDDNNNRLW